MSVAQVDARLIRAKRASIRSRQVLAAARDDLERHQQWLDRHRTAWAEDVKRYERRLNSKLGIRALKRLALGPFLIGPIVCLAFFRLIARPLPNARTLLFSSVAWFRALAGLTRQRVNSVLWPRLRLHATRYAKAARPQYRIPGLDGPLCTGQPPSYANRNFGTRGASREIGHLQTKLVVASFGAVIVGWVVAATAPDADKEPAEVTPPAHASRSAGLPPAVSIHPREFAPNRISGFVVVAAAPAVERISTTRATIAEMISITRPLTVTLEQSDTTTEPLEVTPPARKPKIPAETKAQSKSRPMKQKPQLTLREQLPWLR